MVLVEVNGALCVPIFFKGIGSQIPAVCISVMQLRYVLFASRVPNYMAGRPTSPAEIVNPAAVMTLAMIQSER